MDSIVDILERAKARQRVLDKYVKTGDDKMEISTEIIEKDTESVQVSKLVSETTSVTEKTAVKEISYDFNKKSSTKICSDLPNSPQTPTKTLNIQQENFNMEIKLTSNDNVRLEVEIQERDELDEHEDDGEDGNVDELKKIEQHDEVLRPGVKNRLQRLGKLYSGVDEVDISSPVHRTEERFCEEDDESNKKPTKVSGLSKLRALADTMNQWEDEITPIKQVISKKSTKPPAPKPPLTFARSPMKGPAPKPPTNGGSSPALNAKVTATVAKDDAIEKLPDNKIDKKDSALSGEMLATLEAQGFKRTNSNSRLVYSYAKDKTPEPSDDDNDLDTIPTKDPHLEQIDEEDEEGESKISKLAAKFSSKNDNTKPPKSVDVVAPKATVVLAPKVTDVLSKFNKQDSKENFEKKTPPQSSPSRNYRAGGVLQKATMFEQSPKKEKDPALMSVSERKALFEKNKGAALMPKAAFAMATPIKNEANKPQLKSTVKPNSDAKGIQNKLKSNVKETKAVFSPKKTVSPSKTNDSPTKAFIAESGGIASKMKALLEKKSTISQSQISNSIQVQRQKEMDMLLNRFHKSNDMIPEEDEESSSEEETVSETTKMITDRPAKIVKDAEMSPPLAPEPPRVLTPQKSVTPKRRSKGDSPKVREVLQDVKRIRVSQPKSGRMYPCLSDIEASATETEQDVATTATSPDSSYEDSSSYAESDEPNTSFGREIIKAVCKNQSPKPKRPIFDESTASDISDILDDADDYLDEAYENMEGPTPPKQGRSVSPQTIAPSHSFHYSKGFLAKPNIPLQSVISPTKLIKPSAPPTSDNEDLPIQVVDGDSILPLTHTVSFYRKQQAQGSQTPVRKITRQAPVIEESPEKENIRDERQEVQQKIQELMSVVAKQQTVISQASQALNLCCSTIEFSGSSEQVEAEKLLLVATHRRQAAMHEIQRLKVEGALQAGGGPLCDKANLTISNIVLPLKKEYARALSAAGGHGHHIVCLIRCAEKVIGTKLVSTIASPKDDLQMTLHIPDSVVLDDLYSNFTVTVEVYSLQAQEELLPHEVKYHIKKSGNKLTPRKKQDSKLVMPCVQSPAGPQAIRSSSFSLLGYVVFSMQAINRTHWTLNNTPALSPLDGSLQMTVNCELQVSIEHRGFLTMFEDISGFGAWHRRWCLLKGNYLNYWKYPDDEKKKPPIDSINLQICSTEQVGPVSRDICARPHTFLLETVRPALATDKDSLVTICKGNETIIRHLLSADTKEERVIWCDKFNKSLGTMRIWGKKSKK